jgi:hypothetical protein
MFPGTDDHRISLDEARALVQRRRKLSAVRSDTPICEFFRRDAIDRILAQPGCIGLRVYAGADSQDRQVLVLIGTDAKGRDLTSEIAERGLPCPTFCDDDSPLLK